MDSVYVTQKHEDGKVTLHFDVDADVYDREALMEALKHMDKPWKKK